MPQYPKETFTRLIYNSTGLQGPVSVLPQHDVTVTVDTSLATAPILYTLQTRLDSLSPWDDSGTMYQQNENSTVVLEGPIQDVQLNIEQLGGGDIALNILGAVQAASGQS